MTKLLQAIKYELQRQAFGAPVDQPRVVALIERINEELKMNERAKELPWAQMSGFDVYTSIENYSDSKEDTEEMMQTWLKAKSAPPEVERRDDDPVRLTLEELKSSGKVTHRTSPSSTRELDELRRKVWEHEAECHSYAYHIHATAIARIADELIERLRSTPSAREESVLPGLKAALEIAERYLNTDGVHFLRNDLKDAIRRADSGAK